MQQFALKDYALDHHIHITPEVSSSSSLSFGLMYLNSSTQRFMELRSESPTTVLGKYMDLQGMMYAARLSCGHASLVNLDSLNNLNIKLERERQEKLRKSLGKGRYDEEKKKKKASGTRAEVFHEAISKARSSATVSS